MNGPVTDRHWMAQALALGALGEGRTAPNPLVGCIVVRDGAVVGRGFHRALGRRHAESVALDEAGENARGGTLYVNLEPCDHHGRTPPCTELLIRSGVTRVVAAIQDPDPRVDGRGFRRLQAAGIEVEVGLMAAEARVLNRAFVHRHRSGRPLVTLKAALSMDGQTAAAGGVSKWISGEDARRYAHRLRFRHDAVLVGAETARRDDPRLDVRLPGESAPRWKVVLASGADLDPGLRLFHGDAGATRGVRLYCDASRRASTQPYPKHVEVIPVGRDEQGLDLNEVLADLGDVGVQSVLVEGGARTAGSFLRSGLADDAAWFVSDKLIGSEGATPLLALESVAAPNRAWRLIDRRLIPLGPELLVLGSIADPGDG